MMNPIPWIVIFLVLSTHSQESLAQPNKGKRLDKQRRSKGELSGQYIFIHKSRINKKKVQDQFPVATVMTPTDRVRAKRAGMLSLRDRELFFKRSGLSRYTRRMDHLGKDLLVFRIETQTVRELRELYSAIPKSTLGKAKKSLKSFKRI